MLVLLEQREGLAKRIFHKVRDDVSVGVVGITSSYCFIVLRFSFSCFFLKIRMHARHIGWPSFLGFLLGLGSSCFTDVQDKDMG